MPHETDPVRTWFRFLRLHQRLYAAGGATLKEFGLSVPQFDVLSALSEQEGMSQQDLAAKLFVTKGNVSGLIDRMVDAGLVERRALPSDRRSHALYLTAEGRRKAEQALAEQTRFVTDTLGRLPQTDIVTLNRILTSWRDIARDHIGKSRS